MHTTQAKNLILGALVADAAAMGTHWIYDQAHLRKVAPETPEFIAPNADNYVGVPGYFAHAPRQNGQTSQYGEQVIVMLDALTANDGVYDAQVYANQFRSHFGYGGAWVGYIDGATRETLNNFQRRDDEALHSAGTIPFDGDPKITAALVTKARALIPRYASDTIRAHYEEAIRRIYEDESTIAHGLKVLDQILALPPRYGAVDQQLPAIAKLPGLIASLDQHAITDPAFTDTIDSAVRTTSDHPRSIEFGRICAQMMLKALHSDDLPAIISVGRGVATGEPAALIAQAVEMTTQDTAAVTKHFGMACDLNYGVPSVVHNILTAPSYVEAIRANIYAGGDTCGRAILLGSILGAVYGIGGARGIPQDWIDKLRIDAATLKALC